MWRFQIFCHALQPSRFTSLMRSLRAVGVYSLATFGCKVGVYFRMVSSIVSVFSLVRITVDRFIGILFLLKVALITRKTRIALLISTWFISMTYCIPCFSISKLSKLIEKDLAFLCEIALRL